MVSFGCTGGQHRSVYCAEELAKHLKAKFQVQINLVHKEIVSSE
jgi:RNase adaptor protein for sRNA GlmZ degradation